MASRLSLSYEVKEGGESAKKLVFRGQQYFDQAAVLEVKHRSTSTALTHFISNLFETKDKCDYGSLLLFNYSQTFDSVDHGLWY